MALSVFLEKVWHHHEERLVIRFGFDKQLTEEIRKLPDRTFSGSLRAWHVPGTPQSLKMVGELLVRCGAEIRYHPDFNKPLEKPKPLFAGPAQLLPALSEEAIPLVEKFKSWMRSRRYSKNTIGTYTDALTTFLRYFAAKSIGELNNADLIAFNNQYILANKLSSSYQNQVVNAVKLFFSTIENRKLELELVHRPRREHKLPNVLSKEEVRAILVNTRNLKHRVALSLIYCCGLRRSELLNLKPGDVSSERNLLVIRQAKGFKDRVAPLSERMLRALRDYYKTYKPKTYLFEGWVAGAPYSEKSLQQVLKNSVKLAGITKPVSLHWLRHSYATHLLESGTDLRYIQEILGHKSSRTTEIYTHVSNKQLAKIKTPFDELEL